MKHFFSLIIVVFAGISHAQDTLYFKNKEKQIVQLLEVNPGNIKYKRWDNQSGPTYTILKSDLEQIALSNGKKELMGSAPAVAISQDSSTVKPQPTATEKSKASDTLFFRSGKKQLVTIYDITPTEIKYKPIVNPDGPVYRAPKSDIKQLVFSTGTKQTFSEVAPVYPGPSSPGSGSMAMKGTNDASLYYRHKGGSIGTGIVAFLFPPAGLVPALICSNVPPKEYNLQYPDAQLWRNTDYRAAYTRQAFRMKKKKVWRGFGIGAGASILLAILLNQ